MSTFFLMFSLAKNVIIYIKCNCSYFQFCYVSVSVLCLVLFLSCFSSFIDKLSSKPKPKLHQDYGWKIKHDIYTWFLCNVCVTVVLLRHPFWLKLLTHYKRLVNTLDRSQFLAEPQSHGLFKGHIERQPFAVALMI